MNIIMPRMTAKTAIALTATQTEISKRFFFIFSPRMLHALYRSGYGWPIWIPILDTYYPCNRCKRHILFTLALTLFYEYNNLCSMAQALLIKQVTDQQKPYKKEI